MRFILYFIFCLNFVAFKASYFKYKILKGHTDAVQCLIELNDQQILTGSRDNTMKVWTVKTEFARLTIRLSNQTFRQSDFQINDYCSLLKTNDKIAKINSYSVCYNCNGTFKSKSNCCCK